jgi:hypothetical protein
MSVLLRSIKLILFSLKSYVDGIYQKKKNNRNHVSCLRTKFFKIKDMKKMMIFPRLAQKKS